MKLGLTGTRQKKSQLELLFKRLKGSASSGNFAHSGRPGKVGGSSSGGGHLAIGIKPSDKSKVEKIQEYRKGGQKPRVNKSSISSYENKIRNKKVEHCAIYDKDGNKLFEKKGTESEVRFTADELQRMKGGIVTHNHPPEINGQKYSDGGSFSKSDAQLMVDMGLTEMRAVSTKYDYSLKPKVVNGINVSKGALDQYDLALERAVASANIDYRQGKLNKSDFPVEVTHRAWQDLHDKGFVIYERKEI